MGKKGREDPAIVDTSDGLEDCKEGEGEKTVKGERIGTEDSGWLLG